MNKDEERGDLVEGVRLRGEQVDAEPEGAEPEDDKDDEEGGGMEDVNSILFAENKEIMSLYIGTAKTFLSLSTGALALTMVLREKITCPEKGCDVDWMMQTAWFLYLGAILFSALYQYFAVKFLELYSSEGRAQKKDREKNREKKAWDNPVRCAFGWIVANPGYAYGIMVVLFLSGSLLLVWEAARSIHALHTMSVGR